MFWLADAWLTPLTLIAVDNWAGIPFFMIIWIAGLVNIPKEFYEAALIDGAGRWQAFWHITVPPSGRPRCLLSLYRPSTPFKPSRSNML
jgi:ABC-type sugar transport system permease subunit